MEKKQLTISMLVSGREDTTEKSLQSLENLKKKLDTEIILVDTGCKKSLLEKIEKYADKIIPFTWCNDFAKARNVGLEAAQGEWFLFLDDDEWFEDVTPIIDFFQSGEYQEYHQGAYIARNYTNIEGTAYSDSWVSRMIRIEEDTRFEGRVHESLVPAHGKCKKIHAFVHHYGYVYANEDERKAHVERNIAILEPLIKEEPNNLRWKLQIIQEYVTMQMWDKLRENAEKGLKMAEQSKKPFHNLCRGSFYAAILFADMQEKKWDALWEHYQLFITDERNPWNVRCALAAIATSGLVELNQECDRKLQSSQGSIARNLQEDKAIVRNNDELDEILSNSWKQKEEKEIVAYNGYVSKSEALPKKTVVEKIIDCARTYFHCLKQYQAESREEQWQLIDESAVLVAEYMTQNMQLEMCYFWAEYMAEVLLNSVADTDKTAEQVKLQTEEGNTSINIWLNEQLVYFEQWQYLLIEDIEDKLCGNGEFLSISDNIWKMAEAGVLPLEEMLLSLPMSQWMVQMMVLESRLFGESWKNIGEHLAKICTVDDIRYAFFDMRTEITKMKQMYSVKSNVEKMDYTTITQVLFDFAMANLHYADFVYTEAAFSGEMEFLTEECRAAFWVSQVFSCEETDWSKKLEFIKEAAKAWPVLGEIVKRYAVLIGEEREKTQIASKKAQNELLQMAEAIKPQIYIMVEKGMLQEALTTVKQLRSMIPEDEELAEMEKILLEEVQN